MRLNVIKECGIGLVYVNEEVNYSVFSPPPNESSVVLQEIHGEGSSGSGSSNIDGSESENSDYYSADEGEPSAPLL